MLVARNAMRPFFNAKKDIKRAGNFQLVRQSAPLDRLDQLYRLIENNRAYRFPGLGNAFPRNAIRTPDSTLRDLSPLPLAREMALQAGRLNHYGSDLVRALGSLADVNDAIRYGDWTIAESLASHLCEEHGLSIAGMRKELLISFQVDGLMGLSRRYTTMADSADRRAWALMAHIAYDMMDPAFSPERASRTWLGTVSGRPAQADYYASLVKSELLGSWPTKAALADSLLRYSCTSLIDLALCAWKALATRSEWHEVAGLRELLDPCILSVLEARFCCCPLKA